MYVYIHTYRNWPFFVVEIFSDGTCPKKLLLKYCFTIKKISQSKHFLIRILTRAQTHGVNSGIYVVER